MGSSSSLSPLDDDDSDFSDISELSAEKETCRFGVVNARAAFLCDAVEAPEVDDDDDEKGVGGE
jgi:hypothetical protein